MNVLLVAGAIALLVAALVFASRAWGRLRAERDTLEKAKDRKDAQLRVPRPGDRSVADSLRDGRF
ncbi:MAG: hypothetical protein ACE5H8_02230 [Alphaproteobacteria bacterium]